jgi:hypothetical protein
MRRHVLFFAILFLPSIILGQSQLTLSGIVSDMSTGRPLGGVKITVVGSKANDVVTDSEGTFILSFASEVKLANIVSIHAEKSGYRPYTRTTPISSVPLAIHLERYESNNPKGTKPDISQPPKTPNGSGVNRSDPAPTPTSKPSPLLLKDSTTPEFGRRELPPMVNDAAKMNLSQYYDVMYKGVPTNPDSDELLESWVRPKYPTGFPVVTIPVYVLLYVDSNGKVKRALPILGERAFLVEAFNAALKWKYKQYVKDGHIVPEWKTIITIEFPTDTALPN